MMTLTSDFKSKLSVGVSACWKSPSNIALVKYWGKKAHQIPANPSLSFTLNEAYTITRVTATLNENASGPTVSFRFEGEENREFAIKIEDFLKDLLPYINYLPFVNLIIESGNNFPHSAGIASSASAMSALALSLICIDQKLNNLEPDEVEFKKKASFIARLGSGSACRSIYGGYAIWGKHEDFNGSSDDYAVPIDFRPGKLFESVRDSILIIDPTPKTVSSRAGHMMMKGHPFAEARYKQAVSNLSQIKKSLIENDWELFTEITENEALTLHAMMMTSYPGYILMHPNTLNIVQLIQEIRKRTHMRICYTLDAGPNIHLLYPAEELGKIEPVLDELGKSCYNGKIINDMIGLGPENKNCK